MRGLTVDSCVGVSLGADLCPRSGQAISVHTCAQPMTQARVDETYIEVKGEWKYLYRAVDSLGFTLEFMLSAKRNTRAAERFFRKALKATHNQSPRVINVDKNAVITPSD